MHMNLIVIKDPLYDCAYNPVQTIELPSLHLLTGRQTPGAIKAAHDAIYLVLNYR